MKAQSAIEYLVNYRWILLTAAIIGGAIFTAAEEPDTKNAETVQGLPPHVEVFQYKEATCFMSNNHKGEGITCIPTSELEEEDQQ